ncbi:MAG: uroporphyrinogen decarboxylase family protein [bacterium]|nr:uroporphyrinogen decarboxylase family protein [bacterium]
MPEHLRGNGGMDLYRYLGSEIFLLNGWGTPHLFRAPELRWAEEIEVSFNEREGNTIQEWHARNGTLTAVTHNGHPLKYPVDSLETLRLYREMWESASFLAHDDQPVQDSIDALIGQDGIMTRFWGPSTIPYLLEYAIGTTQFYYLLYDYPEEMKALIDTIHEKELEAFRILANGPSEMVTLCENTSTYYISPEIYRRYNMPHVRDFVDIMHAAGKTAIIHMCGHVADILSDIKETGLDGIHALTPPPIGNTPWEMALDALGDDLIIFGALPANIFLQLPLHKVGPALDGLITPRIAQSRFVLCPCADGLVVPLERFEAVRDWVESRGKLLL